MYSCIRVSYRDRSLIPERLYPRVEFSENHTENVAPVVVEVLQYDR